MHRIILILLLLLTAFNPIYAQDATSDEEVDQVAEQEEDSDAVLESLVVTGTRREARSVEDSPAPIDVLTSEDLLNQATLDLSDALRTVVPSYNVNTQPISDAATLVRPANLRGLSPDHTLVLVNGKRRHRAAVISFLGGGIADGAQGPDISVIPAIALKQVEVLRDGAASQYGSDAIAGVVNFILKDDPSGGSIEAQYGSTYAGDGDNYRFSANLGLPVTDQGFFNISAEFSETDATSRSVQRDDAAGLIAAGNLDVADPAQIWGQPNVNDDLKLFANFGVVFNDFVEMYAFGNYAEREVEGGFFFRNPNTRGGVFSNDNGATLLVGDLTPDGSGNCPTITVTNNVPDPDALALVSADPDCFVFNELFPGGFTPRFGGNLEDKSIVAGFRGVIPVGSGLSYDLSYSYGQNEVDFFINNTVNASLGPDTPTSFVPGGYTQTDNNFNIDFAYGIALESFGEYLSLAAGFEYREEEFEIFAGDPASFAIGPLAAPSAAFPVGQGFSSSSNGFGGFTTASAGANDQSNTAVYFDTELDVNSRLSFQGAIRFEDFDTFGSTTNYKFGGLFKATENLAFRSTYNTGFHAPTAGQANVTNITTAFSGTVLQDQGTIPLSSAAGQFISDFIVANGGERPTLGPEESDSFSIGAVFNVGNIDFTVDLYNIEVDDRISISEQQDFLFALQQTATQNNVSFDPNATTSQLLNALDNAGVLNSADFAGSEDLTSFGFFNNDFDTRTRGIDIVASTNHKFTDDSDTSFVMVWNYNDTDVTDRGNLGDTRLRQLEENLPSWRGTFTVTHNQGPWHALARANFFGSFFEAHLDSGDLPIEAGSEITLDLEIGRRIFDNFDISAGVSNLFDNFPDENPFAGVAGSRFPATAPGGFLGGVYYFRARYDFL